MTKIILLKNTIIHIISYFCILLFVYAAISKWLDFETFQNQLGQSPLLSAYAHWIVWAVPISEILIAIMLSISRFRILGLYGFYTLMVMFTTYIIIILNFTSFTPCSCGGVLEKLGWTEHLVFNIIFIILSTLSVVLLSTNRIKSYITLLLLTIFSSLVVTIIYLSSEKQSKRNNAFIRKYIPHAIEEVGHYNLPSNSFYIAGVDDNSIYLGNYNAPLYIKQLDTLLKDEKEFRISIDSLHLPYRRIRIAVHPPYFYLGDGTIPILFKGNIKDWKASIFSYQDAYFNEFKIIDSLNIGIATTSSINNIDAIGILKMSNDTIIPFINHSLITKKADGVFETNGNLLWNNKNKKFIYTYYYRNSFEIADKDLTYIKTGKTIDTISKPILDIAHYKKTEKYKLGVKSIIVNRRSTTYGDYLYINSDRLGKYETDEYLNSVAIIDVYDITNNTYAFSFYLNHQIDAKLNDFQVFNNLLVSIVDNKLWIHRLKPNYFNKTFK